MTKKEERQIRQEKVYNALKREYSEKGKGVTSYHIWREYFVHFDKELDEYIHEMSRETVTGHLTSLVRQKKVIREMVIEEYEWEGNVYQYSVNKYKVNENAD